MARPGQSTCAADRHQRTGLAAPRHRRRVPARLTPHGPRCKSLRVMRRPKPLVLVVAAVCVVALVAGIVAFSRTSSRGPSRIVVLGLDGMDPQTIDLLMAEGKLPNFAKLRRDGAYGAPAEHAASAEPRHLDHDRDRQDARSARHRPLRRRQPADRRAAAGHEPDAQGEGAVEHPLRQGPESGGRRLVGDLARRERQRLHRQRPHLLPLPLQGGPGPGAGRQRDHVPAGAVREDRAHAARRATCPRRRPPASST